MKYKNKDFDFLSNLEVPQAKTVEKSFSSIDSAGEKIYMQMKLQCVMKDSWRISNFPFDRQRLRLSFENSQFDSRYLVFKEDTVGNHYDPRFTLRGWTIDSCDVTSGIKAYETAFGDDDSSNHIQNIVHSGLGLASNGMRADYCGKCSLACTSLS